MSKFASSAFKVAWNALKEEEQVAFRTRLHQRLNGAIKEAIDDKESYFNIHAMSVQKWNDVCMMLEEAMND